MKKSFLLAGVLAALSLSAVAAERPAVTDINAADEASFLAAGGSAWAKVAPGVYQHELANGELQRRAFGEAGRTYDLARLHETAHELEASLRSIADPTERAELADAILRLQDNIRTLEAQAAPVKTRAKTATGPQLSGTFHDQKSDGVCEYDVLLSADMNHIPHGTWDYASAQSTGQTWADDFGPPPSLRLVIQGYAKVTNAGRSYLKPYQKSVIPPVTSVTATSGLAQTNAAYPALGCTMETSVQISGPVACGGSGVNSYTSLANTKYCTDF